MTIETKQLQLPLIASVHEHFTDVNPMACLVLNGLTMYVCERYQKLVVFGTINIYFTEMHSQVLMLLAG